MYPNGTAGKRGEASVWRRVFCLRLPGETELPSVRITCFAGCMATEWTLTVDCADPARLAAFRKQALGYRDRPAPDGFSTWPEWFSSLGVPEAEWNDGAYIDDQAGGGRAEPFLERWSRVRAAVAELVDAGGVLVHQYNDADGRPDHVVMRDPEGNEFCVV